ncbi:N(2)-fixation sustaining protein CowN [Pseudothauera rhizosphaerae]|uniref:N(2)-fixation sustaining protein CowN n=1 Tax=Pseudothauera rhizosphaerae TaxID=2565932 RepID=A0A4S4ATQ8_9RHOO|nr:N(2)-fixation sustaining protein CowN [Pseudothauera rhizosphaerae]THF63266.1 N(2)-fixation sustaining protein CowN [Pseudothauera rhizosphaerae]
MSDDSSNDPYAAALAANPFAQALDKPDRYVSFCGIDCDGNARLLMQYVRRHIDVPGQSNAFWDQFRDKLEGRSSQRCDELFLVHSYINMIRELFETYEDDEALALLDKIEEECC